MIIAPRKISRAISAIILLSAVLAAIDLIGGLTFTDDFSASSSFLFALYLLPSLFVIVGAATLFTSQNFGYVLIYAGFAFSIFGYYWLYVPFIPLPIGSFEAVIFTMLGINGIVVATLVWCHVQEKKNASAHSAA